ncbi:DUF2516 family protein [Nonomuraea sp. NPDC050310]|uniref:DUF2516 family protein n=1 Tax=unclassified Nonomuraea TaxID=2593643 RepID=UPI0033F168EE
MSLISGGLNILFLVLAIAIFGMSAYAFVHALRVPANAFVAAGKLKKNIWLLILGLATLLSAGGGFAFFQDLRQMWALGLSGFIGLGAISIFSIASVIAATVYIVDVKPAVKGMGGRGGGHMGPYGPW